MSIISNLKNILKTLLQTEARDSVESEMNKVIITKNTKWYQEHKQPTKQKEMTANNIQLSIVTSIVNGSNSPN